MAGVTGIVAGLDKGYLGSHTGKEISDQRLEGAEGGRRGPGEEQPGRENHHAEVPDWTLPGRRS